MHLYHLTIQPPTLITQMLVGSFTGTPKQQEIVLVRGDRFIETVRVNSSGNFEQLKVVDSVLSGFSSAAVQPVFGTIRSLALLRAPGENNRDYLAVGSDSGATVILSLNAAAAVSGSDSMPLWRWERVAGMIHGRSGNRRAIPGQMIAVDPKGRALMTAALESKKFAHTIGRLGPDDSKSYIQEKSLNLSSPLESHRPGHLCQALVALDSGIEHHPAFATIEFDFGELDTLQLEQKEKSPISLDSHLRNKLLCYYELDLGLNNVVRKWSEPIPFEVQTLLAVPGPAEGGPGGVLLFTPGRIIYHRPGLKNNESSDDSFGVPSNHLILPESHVNLLISSHALVKTKSVFFVFIQYENGDLFKLSFSKISQEAPNAPLFSIKYFDTIPRALAMCVLKSGFLMVAAERGPFHLLYQIVGLGDEDSEQPEFTSGTFASTSLQIKKHDELVNLVECDKLPHFGTVTGGFISNLGNEDSPQFYLTHKDSQDSASVSVTRWGTALQESLAIEFGDADRVSGAWATESNHILLSLEDSSVLLKVDLETSEIGQVNPDEEDSSFFVKSLRLDCETLTAGHLKSSSEDSTEASSVAFIQIHPSGFQLINESKMLLREWTPGPGKKIRAATFNYRQIILTLESLEMIRLVFDPSTGSVTEESGAEETFPTVIDHVAIAPLLKGRKSSRWLAIGTVEDCVLRILDLEAPEVPEVTAIQALTSPPTSIKLVREESALVLHVGLSGGVLIRFNVDEQSGALLSPSSRFVGGQVVKISDPFADGSILALGARPWWISRDHLSRPINSPLFFSSISIACPLNGSTFLALAEGTLRILSVQPGNSAGPFYRHALELPSGGVPRRIALDSKTGIFAIAQMDRLSLFDPFSGSIGTAIEFHSGEVALSCCFVQFHDRGDQLYLAVIGARGFSPAPRRSADESFIDLFPIDTKTAKLGDRLHRTPTESPATCLHAFNGRLLVGVGNDLRMYECGRSRMLRKTQCKLGSPIVSIRTQGLRIYVGTVRDSHTLLVYRPDSNGIVPIADDPLPRGVISDCLLDYDTLAGCDRFGNFFIDRLPAAVSESLEQDRFLASSGVGADAREYLLAAPEKFEKLAEFHIGDVIPVMERIAWAGESAGREAIWYVSVSGAIGCLLPFPTKSFAAFAQSLEKAFESAASFNTDPLHNSLSPRVNLLIRSHVAYRSAFAPVKSVIDGDLLEQFLALPEDLQHSLAQSIDLSPTEIKTKINELRRLIGI